MICNFSWKCANGAFLDPRHMEPGHLKNTLALILQEHRAMVTAEQWAGFQEASIAVLGRDISGFSPKYFITQYFINGGTMAVPITKSKSPEKEPEMYQDENERAAPCGASSGPGVVRRELSLDKIVWTDIKLLSKEQVFDLVLANIQTIYLRNQLLLPGQVLPVEGEYLTLTPEED